MNHPQIKSLTDAQLETSIASVRARELETLSGMLAHLREIDRRRLYSKRGYRSLHDYAIRKLKYSEDQAHRRVSAARVSRDLPEVESKIADGSLKLTHLTDAHTLFRKVEHTKEEKLAVLQKLENTTRAEARKVLQREEVNARYSFEADQTLEEAVEELRGLHAHLSFDELMRKVCMFAREKLDPMRSAKTASVPRAARDSAGVTKSPPVSESSPISSTVKVPTNESRYIPTHVKRQVWINAGGKCQHCSSKFGLEYDHVIPFALGGDSSAGNLRLLCRNCNQRKAIEHFGLSKMSKHLHPSANPSAPS